MVRVTIKRDLRGRPVAIGTSVEPGRFSTIAYHADGSPKAETLAGGTLERGFTQDAMGRLVAIDDPAFAEDLSYRVGGAAAGPYGDGSVSAEATRWKAEAFPQQAPAGPARAYGFDPFGRLVAAADRTRPGAALAWSQDANGNRLTAQAGATQSIYAYEAGGDRLRQVTRAGEPALPLTHDPDGAVASVGRTALRHDGLAGRASGTDVEGRRFHILRDAAGEHVSTIETGPEGARRLTLRDGAAPLLEIDGAGRQDLHVHGPSGLVALILDGVAHAVSTDQRGSVRAAWSGGRVAAAFDYLPYGGLDGDAAGAWGALAPRIRTRYAGQEWDEASGLYDMHARLYDPALGRFLSPDPAGEGASPYAAMGDDPVDYLDPTGEERIIARVFVRLATSEHPALYIFTDRKDRILVMLDGDVSYQRFQDVLQQTPTDPDRLKWKVGGGSRRRSLT